MLHVGLGDYMKQFQVVALRTESTVEQLEVTATAVVLINSLNIHRTLAELMQRSTRMRINSSRTASIPTEPPFAVQSVTKSHVQT